MMTIAEMIGYVYEEAYNYDGDPIAAPWPLIKSPAPIIIIAISYLVIVLKIGPSLMKNRAPIELNNLLIIYNVCCVLANIFVTTSLFIADNGFVDLLSTCHGDNYPYYMYARSSASWWFFMSKLFELFDTMFMILRKKNSQISFFHVFHHTFTITYVYGCLKFFPGIQGSFHALLNAGVHIIMYTYYMLAAFGPRYKKYLWWKKYLTQLQLLQFLTVFVYLIYVFVSDCNLSKGLTYYEFVNCIVFIYLFVDFYAKEYSGSRKKDVSKVKSN